jgi:hypothetical protein
MRLPDYLVEGLRTVAAIEAGHSKHPSQHGGPPIGLPGSCAPRPPPAPVAPGRRQPPFAPSPRQCWSARVWRPQRG